MQKNKDKYMILAGDFNSVLWEQKTFLDFFTKKGLCRAQIKGRSWHGFITLDHIFHTPNIKVTAKMDNFKASDHYPISAKIQLN